MKKPTLTLIAITGILALAGCQNTQRSGGTQAPSISRTSIQGDWRATNGPLLASFTGTRFQSVNTENNQVVASGAFKYNSPADIRLEWVGALSGRSSAQCRLIDANLMDCTPSNGSGFQMRRI